MKLIPRIILTVLLCLPAIGASGQDYLTELRRELLTQRISLDYSYKMLGEVPLTGSGKLLMQGNCYHISGNGLEIWCDGAVRWTVDGEAKEVYIEDAAETEAELFFTNPELLLANVSGVTCGPDSLKGIWTDPSGRGRFSFSLTGIKSSALTEGFEEFRFDASGLGDEWSVTDLR